MLRVKDTVDCRFCGFVLFLLCCYCGDLMVCVGFYLSDLGLVVCFGCCCVGLVCWFCCFGLIIVVDFANCCSSTSCGGCLVVVSWKFSPFRVFEFCVRFVLIWLVVYLDNDDCFCCWWFRFIMCLCLIIWVVCFWYFIVGCLLLDCLC